MPSNTSAALVLLDSNKQRTFAISGQRGTARTPVHKCVQPILRDRFKGKYNFVFLENPLGDNLPFPLLWDEDERQRHPTTRLFGCWTKLNHFCHTKLVPHLTDGSIIITDGFGLDALLYSTALCCHEDDNRQAIGLHSDLVEARLVRQKISPPEYFIIRADVDVVDKRLVDKLPQLAAINQTTRHDFIRYEERAITAYFRSVHNQKTPHYIDAALSVEEMAQSIAQTIEQRVNDDSSATVAA